MVDPTSPGWYPEEASGGTRYWDGHRWTGDTRPQRRTFAAKSSSGVWGIALTIAGALFLVACVRGAGQLQTETSAESIAGFVSSVLIGLALVIGGVYLLRGQGPSTRSVLVRLRHEQLAHAARNAPPPPLPQSASQTIQINIGSSSPDTSAAAAQIQAIANPETAKALQNLQNLLYTRVITDEEFQAAKNKLLGNS